MNTTASSFLTPSQPFDSFPQHKSLLNVNSGLSEDFKDCIILMRRVIFRKYRTKRRSNRSLRTNVTISVIKKKFSRTGQQKHTENSRVNFWRWERRVLVHTMPNNILFLSVIFSICFLAFIFHLFFFIRFLSFLCHSIRIFSFSFCAHSYHTPFL